MLKDAATIQSIKEGKNQEIIGTLYKKVLPEVKRFIRKNGGNDTQAEDVFQESVIAFILAVKKGIFKENNNIVAFIKVVARNKWCDQFKAKLKEKAVKIKTEDERIQENKVNEDQVKTLQILLQSLGEQCEKLLRLSVFQGSI